MRVLGRERGMWVTRPIDEGKTNLMQKPIYFIGISLILCVSYWVFARR